MATAGPATSSASPAVFTGITVNLHTLTLEVWETALDSVNNTSTINARLKENCGNNNYSAWTCTGSITIDGSTYALTTQQYSNATKGATITVGTKTKSVNHTGKTTIAVSAVFQFSDQTPSYKITTGTSVSGTYRLADTGYVSTPAPTAPTSLSASSNDSTGINLSWSGASGSITDYGIWYSSISNGAPATTDTPDFTTTNTTYTDTGAGQGGTRYYWVRAQGVGGNSAWYPSGGTGVSGTQPVPITYYTASFTNSYGSNGTPSNQSIASGSSGTFPNPGTRAGYTFTGWNGNANYYAGAATPAIYSDTTFSADLGWTPITPGFTDETVTPQLSINQTIQSTSNASVAASNTGTNPYSLQYGGTGTYPSWLTINAATGALSGSTNVPGTYTFTVNALGLTAGQSVTSKVITITVVYPGKRINSTFGQSSFATAKRYDSNAGWVALTQMKRWNGSSWVDLTN